MNYNLLEEHWIPVLYNDGTFTRVGILDAFTDATRIRQIAATNPMDRVAILRFLIALLHWCRGNSNDEQPPGPLPPAWLKKLHDYRDCFNLLGDGKRFYQRSPAHGAETKLPATYLVQEVPTGTNSWHFRHSTDMRNGLCAACCAMGLLRLPAFATSAGRGKPPGINRKPPVYVTPVGASLAETLALSWQKVTDADLGTPAWEDPHARPPKHGDVPLLVGLTWLPRQVWLDDPEEPPSNCISCAREEPLIRQCVFAGTGSTKAEGPSQARAWNDPHTVSAGDRILTPRNALGAADAAAGKWTDLLAGALAETAQHRTATFRAVCFATVQNDKYLEATEYAIRLPGPPEEAEARQLIETLKKWQKQSWKLLARAKPTESGRDASHIDTITAVTAIRPEIESQVSAEAGDLIGAGDEAWEKAAGKYPPMMAALAKSLSPGYTTAALERRWHIERTKPNMRPEPKAPKKAATAKRGNQ